MFSLKKKKDSLLSLEDIFPREVNIYGLAHCELSDISDTRIENQEFDNRFKNSFSVIFNFSGEITGQAIIEVSSEDLAKLNVTDHQEESNLRDMIIEASNIVLGKFIGFLENKMDVIGTISAPMVFNEPANSNHQESMKKLRMGAALLGTLGSSEFYEITYNFIYDENAFPMKICLITRITDSAKQQSGLSL